MAGKYVRGTVLLIAPHSQWGLQLGRKYSSTCLGLVDNTLLVQVISP
jgi:hypothetical protein